MELQLRSENGCLCVAQSLDGVGVGSAQSREGTAQSLAVLCMDREQMAQHRGAEPGP